MPSRVRLETAELTFGEFDCPPGDPLWNAVNANIGARPHLVAGEPPRAGPRDR